MKTNVGSYDSGFRFLLGCGVLFAGINGLGWWSLLGFIPILSAAFDFCPIYFLLHLNTSAWEEAFEARHCSPKPTITGPSHRDDVKAHADGLKETQNTRRFSRSPREINRSPDSRAAVRDQNDSQKRVASTKTLEAHPR